MGPVTMSTYATRRQSWLAAGAMLGALALVVWLLTWGRPQWPVSEIRTDAIGLRTYTWLSEWNGIMAACRGSLDRGLTAELRFARDTAEPLWLEPAPGRRASVIWPAGTRVEFEPEPALFAPDGRLAGRAGDSILMDVEPESAAGTFDDPYIADGRVFGGCYHYRRPPAPN
jgi:hypothetical protein